MWMQNAVYRDSFNFPPYFSLLACSGNLASCSAASAAVFAGLASAIQFSFELSSISKVPMWQLSLLRDVEILVPELRINQLRWHLCKFICLKSGLHMKTYKNCQIEFFKQLLSFLSSFLFWLCYFPKEQCRSQCQKWNAFQRSLCFPSGRHPEWLKRRSLRRRPMKNSCMGSKCS